jgi:hypothetical protein
LKIIGINGSTGERPVLVYKDDSVLEVKSNTFGLTYSSKLEISNFRYLYKNSFDEDYQGFFTTNSPTSLLVIRDSLFESEIAVSRPFVCLGDGTVEVVNVVVRNIEVDKTYLFFSTDSSNATTRFVLRDISFIDVIGMDGASGSVLFGADHICDFRDCPDTLENIHGAFNVLLDGWSVEYSDSDANLGNKSLIIIINQNESSLFELNNIVVNFKNVDNVPANGGVASFTGSKKCKITISDSSFSNSESLDKGGILYFDVVSGTEILITKCNFSGSSSEFGGAIYTNVVFTVSYSEFVDNSANNGRDIYYYWDGSEDFTDDNVIDSCSFPQDDSLKPYIGTDSPKVADYDGFLLYSCIVKEFFISAAGSDLNNCNISRPCKTFNRIFGAAEAEDISALSVGIVSAEWVSLVQSSVENNISDYRILLYPANNFAITKLKSTSYID